jgi:hypothetical protein
VHGVGVDRLRKVGADGARRGLARVGCAHQLAVPGDRILAFEDLDHHRATGHEVDQVLEERPLAVHRVEAFGLGPRQPRHAGRHDAQAGFLETGVDLADDVLGDGIRLDDRKGAFQGHEGLRFQKLQQIQNYSSRWGFRRRGGGRGQVPRRAGGAAGHAEWLGQQAVAPGGRTAWPAGGGTGWANGLAARGGARWVGRHARATGARHGESLELPGGARARAGRADYIIPSARGSAVDSGAQ